MAVGAVFPEVFPGVLRPNSPSPSCSDGPAARVGRSRDPRVITGAGTPMCASLAAGGLGPSAGFTHAGPPAARPRESVT